MNEQSLATHLIRVQPIFDFVAGRFDAWIAGLKKSGVHLTIQTNDSSPLHIRGGIRRGPPARVALFKGGEIKLNIFSGEITEGKLRSPCTIQLHANTPRILSDPLWQIEIRQGDYELSLIPGPVKYKTRKGTLNDPITDKEFMIAVQTSFDEVFAWAADDATAPSQPETTNENVTR